MPLSSSSFFVNKAGPIHAAAYISTDQILLASGAGPSKTGQRNRIASYSISASLASSEVPAERQAVTTGEALLADDEDAPSSFAIHGDLVIAGVNESAALRRKTGDNHHLRTFRLSRSTTEKGDTTTIKTLPQHQIYDDLSLDLDDYQKTTRISASGKYAALLSAQGRPALVDLQKMTKIPLDAITQLTPHATITDLAFLHDDSLIHADDTRIFLTRLPPTDAASTSMLLDIRKTGIPRNYRLSHIRMLDRASLIVGVTQEKLRVSFVAVYKIYKGFLVQREVVHFSSKVRDIYISPSSSSSSSRNTQSKEETEEEEEEEDVKEGSGRRMVAVTTANGDLTILTTSLTRLHRIKSLHAFPISCLAIRPDNRQLITASIDEKVNVIEVPINGVGAGRSGRVVVALVMLMIVLLVSLIIRSRMFDD